MNRELTEKLKVARQMRMTPEAKERQRRSFAFGNTHIENDRITKRTIEKAADRLSAPAGVDDAIS